MVNTIYDIVDKKLEDLHSRGKIDDCSYLIGGLMAIPLILPSVIHQMISEDKS